MKFKKLSYPYLIWLMIFIMVPLLLVAYYAFTTGNFELSNPEWSIEAFQRFFNSQHIKVLWKSLEIAFLSTVICLLIGYPFAYLISQAKMKARNMMILLVVIPMWMNFLLRTYAWLTILNKNGILNLILTKIGLEPLNLVYTKEAVLIGMVYNFLPFMVLPIYSVIEKIDKDLLEASMDLGATRWQTFWRVVLPMSFPGIVTGITMVFIPAVSTFEISSLLGGNKHNLMGNLIEQQFRVAGDWHFGSAMSLILMVLILVALLITNRFGDEESEIGGGLW